MEQNQTKKDLKDHKFPHLQKEVDSLLENFDNVAYGIDEFFSNEQEEFNHINIDDVMAGRTEQKVSRPKVSVVEKARLQEKKLQALNNESVNVARPAHGDVLLARRETKTSLEEIRLISLSPNKGIKEGLRNSRVIKLVSIIFKYLKF